MTNIVKNSLISQAELDNKYYFKSLIDIAFNKKVITLDELNYLQRESINLLKRIVEMLTGNESSAIKYDQAKVLLDSAYFTIGIYLKNCATPDDAIQELLNTNLYEIYKRGNNLIEKYQKKYEVFLNLIKSNMLKLPNHAYINTPQSINEFFKKYNKDFNATDIIIVADYQLCNGNPDLLGIEFIMEYLDNFNLENLFLQKYKLENIYSLLNRISNISGDLIINIFKQVIITTIAEELSDHLEYYLYVDILEVESIYMKLSDKSNDELDYIIKSAINKIYAKLEVNDKIKTYINECYDNIISNIKAGIKNDNLDIIFGTNGEIVGE